MTQSFPHKMGNNTSKLEALHKNCLLHIAKEQNLNIQEQKLIQLLTWVKTNCHRYPTKNSYDLNHWNQVGDALKACQTRAPEINSNEFITWTSTYSA